MNKECPLCNPPEGQEIVLYSNPIFRIIQVEDPHFPGYFRVISQKHVKEMSDLPVNEQILIIEALSKMEEIVIATMEPTKVNWAQLGNMVPHLHWHLIARYEDDATFPGSIWNPVVRKTDLEILRARELKAKETALKIARMAEERF